jgi:hypothetical protein
MHRNVEALIGRLATDSNLRRRFAGDPMGLLETLIAEGFELTEVELAALAATDPRAIDRFSSALDSRLRKASFSNAEQPLETRS